MWYNEGRNIVMLGGACDTPNRIHLIGDVPMDTLPPHALDDNFHFVYELVDPRDASIFYVGITINLLERFKQHMRCDSSNVPKNQRIQEILEDGHLPFMRTKERIYEFEQALARERFWISHYLERGVQLLNIAGASPAPSPKPKPTIGQKRIRNIVIHVDSWILVDFPICKRYGRFVTVEHATDEEFQDWLEWNQIDDSILEEVRVPSTATWKFDHRVLIINHALDQGMSLELADGRIIRLAQEGA